jgi:hypothetical protein
VGTADLEHLPPLLAAEASEVLASVDDDLGLLRGGERVQGGAVRDAEAALGGEGTAFDPSGLAADEGQERRAALDERQLILEATAQLQEPVISR